MRRPNVVQRLLHRFFMLRPVTAFFAPRVHLLDSAVLRFSRGRFSAAALLGWTIIQLTTTGAKTGQPRTLPLVGIFENDRIALMGTSFGRRHNPGWYYNLKLNPECSVLFQGKSRNYVARELEGEEYEKFFQMAVDQYAGYQTYRERAAHRHIPVMLLEPKNDSSANPRYS